MLRGAFWATVTILVAPLLNVTSDPSTLAAAGPQLSITTAKHVSVGQPIEIDVALRDAPMVAGYEASVRYDEAAGEFAGVVFGEGSGSGNVVTTITSGPAGGVAYSAYTCLASGCPARSSADGRNALEHVTVRIEPLEAGRHVVTFDQLKFVDLRGRSVDVDVPVHSVTIDVSGDDPSTSVFASPDVAFVLPSDADAGSASSALDINRSGATTSADANQLATSWGDARRFGACTAAGAADPNGDGCLDVADLQLIGSSPAVATKSGGRDDTSIQQAALLPWVVNTINDLPDSNIGNGKCETANGDCSLRAAIHEANASAGADVINFAIPGGGVHTIQLTGQLPVINDASGGVTIDGYTQPGSSPNTDPLVSNAVIAVEVRGNGSSLTDPATGFDAFTIVSANNRIQGLSIYNVFNHFELSGAGATNNVIVGNFIGSDAGSTFVATPHTEGGSGITMINGTNHNWVGTAALADRNVIAGTPSTGIRIQHEGTNANVVQNNLFGLKPHGDAGLRLGFHGLDIQFGAKNNLIGGPGLHERNVISGATSGNGVDLSHQPDTTGNRVIGNFIGTTPAGNATAVYTQNMRGVTFKDGVTDNFVSENIIGGMKEEAIWVQFDTNGRNFIFNNHVGVALDGSAIPNAKHGMYVQGHDFQVGPGNVFANNASGGIIVTVEPGHAANASIRNRLSGNTFGTNGGLAIDLAPVGPTPNDAGDGDSGANQLLNYPVLVPASTTRVTGTACAACRVEVYKAIAQLGRGVGQKLVGVVDDTAADGSFTAIVGGLSVGDNVAAIAIDDLGNTSEFSPLAAVTSVGPAPPEPPDSSPASFVSLQPARLLDTRGQPTVDGQFQGGGPVGQGGTVELTVANRGGVPIDADAVVLNVTVTEGAGPGFVTVYPCGSSRPLTSNLNFSPGQSVPNAVIAKIGFGGAVCLYVSAGTQLIADVTGYFPPGSSYNSLVPARLLDTRAGSPTVDGQFQGGGAVPHGGTVELTVTDRGGIPADATAVVLNVTVTETAGSGFVTAYPCGQAFPVASNVNYVAGQTVPNLVITKVGAGGKVCLFSEASAQLVADASGYFAPESSYTSLLPSRLLDTRAGFATTDGQFQGAGLVGAGSTVALKVTERGGVPATASAVVLNVTSTGAVGPGFVTVYPCGQAQPLTSSLNFVPGLTAPNVVIARIGTDGTVCLFASNGTHLIADVDGYFPSES
jgi:CSLREA domain-containing protein